MDRSVGRSVSRSVGRSVCVVGRLSVCILAIHVLIHSRAACPRFGSVSLSLSRRRCKIIQSGRVACGWVVMMSHLGLEQPRRLIPADVSSEHATDMNGCASIHECMRG